MGASIGVIGTGSWGTALAQVLSDNGCDVLLYGIDPVEIADINENHKNSKYFGEDPISDRLRATDRTEALTDYNDAFVIAVPTRALAATMESISPYLRRDTLVINASKGFEAGTGKRISDYLRDCCPAVTDDNIASIIGPSHAEEVIRRYITSLCAVSRCEETANRVQQLFANGYFRVYVTSDEAGAEYGVAVKNVIAIASGILTGLGYGDNAKAALITRGLREMIKYGTAGGADRETFFGLTGVGDLIVTCFSPHSRNFRYGCEIGRADSIEPVRDTALTVEGVGSCKAVYEHCAALGYDVPIIESVYNIIYRGSRPSDELSRIMGRPLKREDL